MRIVMAQINSTVGDLEGNAKKIKEYTDKSRKLHGDLVVFPELAITGYPPQDLLYEKSFIRENKKILNEIFESNDIIIARARAILVYTQI